MNAPEGLDLVRLKIYVGSFALRFLFYYKPIFDDILLANYWQGRLLDYG